MISKSLSLNVFLGCRIRTRYHHHLARRGISDILFLFLLALNIKKKGVD
jgi:hypothetical protein